MNTNALRERANAGLHDHVFAWLKQQPWFTPQTPVLDIGCGTGAWLQRLVSAAGHPSNDQADPQFMGIDMDSQQFDLPGVAHQAMDIDSYRGQVWGSFELVTAIEIIEHLSNPGMLLQMAGKNLVDGGYLLLSTPNIHGLPARLRFLARGRLNHFDNKSDATHIYPVYYENLERLASRYGFRVEHTGFFPARGYRTYRGLTRLVSTALGLFLPDHFPGDNLIILLRKTDL